MPEINQDSGQFIMPGPQFNQEKPEENWFNRRSTRIIIGLIVFLLVIGGGYFYKNYQQRKAALKPALENILPTATPTNANVEAPAEEPSPKQADEQNTVSPAEIRKTDGSITIKVAKGNGATHLARYALKEYLKDNPEDLKAEQKIYIEDYLQKHVSHSQILKVNDEISFSGDLIREAIDSAQKLTDSQINNLSKYVPLVPSLQTP